MIIFIVKPLVTPVIDLNIRGHDVNFMALREWNSLHFHEGWIIPWMHRYIVPESKAMLILSRPTLGNALCKKKKGIGTTNPAIRKYGTKLWIDDISVGFVAVILSIREFELNYRLRFNVHIFHHECKDVFRIFPILSSITRRVRVKYKAMSDAPLVSVLKREKNLFHTHAMDWALKEERCRPEKTPFPAVEINASLWESKMLIMTKKFTRTPTILDVECQLI